MQYVLSQEEMDATRQKASALDRLPSVEKLQEFCTFVADNLILTTGWAKGRVWGCILSKPDRMCNYCDDCPAKGLCPYEYKEWSK